MELIYKDKHLVAVFKPAGVPSQPDLSGDNDAMTIASSILKGEGEKNTELYLVHRLDRVVGGILVFARNRAAAARLSQIMSERTAEKEYVAVVEGEPEGGILKDFLYKDARAGKAFVTDRKRAGVKEASLEYIPIECIETERGKRTLVRVKLHSGRFHQIRVQFASRKHPIVGDGKYGINREDAKKGYKFQALYAYKLKFKNTGEENSLSYLEGKEFSLDRRDVWFV